MSQTQSSTPFDTVLRVLPRRMGRPSFGLVKTTVLPPDVVARIEALVGKGGVAAFLRRVLAKVLERLEMERESNSDE